MVTMVDVDNILWNFSTPIFKELYEINRDIPVPDKWDRWNVFDDYIEKEELYEVFDRVHMRQCAFPPFDGARELLQYLEKIGHIVIASNRGEGTYEPLSDWLRSHYLPYDLIHVSYDKTKLFDTMVMDLVIDDNPFVLKEAERRGITAVGLEYPWNKGKDFILFKNLQEMLLYLRGEYGYCG